MSRDPPRADPLRAARRGNAERTFHEPTEGDPLTPLADATLPCFDQLTPERVSAVVVRDAARWRRFLTFKQKRIIENNSVKLRQTMKV